MHIYRCFSLKQTKNNTKQTNRQRNKQKGKQISAEHFKMGKVSSLAWPRGVVLCGQHGTCKPRLGFQLLIKLQLCLHIFLVLGCVCCWHESCHLAAFHAFCPPSCMQRLISWKWFGENHSVLFPSLYLLLQGEGVLEV